MTIEDKIKNVEKVINTFSEECRKNFYKNIKTLKIEKVDYLKNSTATGLYNSKENKILYVNEECIEHELFHMACNSGEKRKIEKLENVYVLNGIELYSEEENEIYNRGLNEGFIESLARKSNGNSKDECFELFIVGLLADIYGEEIYKFVLTNDPIGFYRFCSINVLYLSSTLDIYDKSLDAIDIVRNSKTTEVNGKTKKEHAEILMNIVLENVIESLKYIILEYKTIENPNITKEELKEKIELYYKNKSFLAFGPVSEFLKNQIDEVIEKELIDDSKERQKSLKIN